MKAKLLIFNDQMELVLKNGQSIFPKKGESKKDLISRASKSVKKEFESDLDVKEWTIKNVKAGTTNALLKSVEPETGKAAGLFRVMIIEVLALRNKLPEHLKETPKKETPKKETPKKENTARENALAEFKNSKEYKNAKKNVGKSCHYTSRTFPDKTRKGTVKGLLINRKADKAYYMILNTSTGKRESTTLDSVTF